MISGLWRVKCPLADGPCFLQVGEGVGAVELDASSLCSWAFLCGDNVSVYLQWNDFGRHFVSSDTGLVGVVYIVRGVR